MKKFMILLIWGQLSCNFFIKKVHDFVDLMIISSNFFIKMFMFRLFWGEWHATFSWKSSRFRWFEDNYHMTWSWNCLRFGRFEGNIMWFFLKKSIIKLFRALLVQMRLGVCREIPVADLMPTDWWAAHTVMRRWLSSSAPATRRFLTPNFLGRAQKMSRVCDKWTLWRALLFLRVLAVILGGCGTHLLPMT